MLAHLFLRFCFYSLWSCHFSAIWSDLFPIAPTQSSIFLVKFQQKWFCCFWKLHSLKIRYLTHQGKEDLTAVSPRNSNWREIIWRQVHPIHRLFLLSWFKTNSGWLSCKCPIHSCLMPMSHKKNAPNQGHHSLQGFARCGCSDWLPANVVPQIRKDHLLPVFPLKLPRMNRSREGSWVWRGMK